MELKPALQFPKINARSPVAPLSALRFAFGSRVTGRGSRLCGGDSRVTIHDSRFRGFTLIELMVVLAIIATLVSIVAPNYGGRIRKAEETVLREDLMVMREALDKYFADAGKYPDTLQDLVSKRYLRNVPSDPLTQSSATWTIIAPADSGKGSVYDVRSGAKGSGSDGKAYAEW